MTNQPANPFRYLNASPEVIRPVVVMYVKYPLSLRNVDDLLHERGINAPLARGILAGAYQGGFSGGSTALEGSGPAAD
jgi:hypothetical protein